MTIRSWDDLKAGLELTGMPVAYDHFDAEPEGNRFIAVIEKEVSPKFTGNKNFGEIISYEIEFYSTDKDLEGEREIEVALKNMKLTWKRQPTVWIAEAQRFVTVYETGF